MNNLTEAIAGVIICEAILEGVPEAGAPSGVLYAQFLAGLGHHANLMKYNTVLGTLQALHAIKVSDHYVTRGKNYTRVLESFKKAQEAISV